MIFLLTSLLVLIIIWGIVWYIITLLPIPQPWKNIALAILFLIALLCFLSDVGVIPDNGWGDRSR